MENLPQLTASVPVCSGAAGTGRRPVRRRSWRWHLPATLFLAGIGAGSVSGALSFKEWHTTRSPHFRVFSNTSPVRTLQITNGMEILCQVLQTINPDLQGNRLPLNMPRTTAVFIFNSKNGLKEATGKSDNAGFFSARPDFNCLALVADSNEGLAISYHEYLHNFLHTNLDQAPLWLDEGLAEFYSTMAIDGDKVILGKHSRENMEILTRFSLLPMSRLLQVERDSPEYRKGDDRYRFYATSWLLVHTLLTTTPERRQQLALYLDQLRQRVPGDQAREKVFGNTLENMDRILAVQLEQIKTKYAFWTFNFNDLKPPSIPAPQPVPPAGIAAWLGILTADPEEPAAAGNFFQAACQLMEPCALAEAGRGYLLYRQKNETGALQALQNAAKLSPEEPYINFLLGRLLAEKLLREWTGGGAGSTGNSLLKQARECLRLSLAQDQGNPEAVYYWAVTYFLEPDRAKEGVRLMEQALRKMPGRQEIVLDLARMDSLAGNYPRALVLCRSLLQSRMPEIREEAAEWESRILDRQAASRFNEGLELLEKQEIDSGMLQLEEAIKLARDPDLRSRLEEQRQSIQQELANRKTRPGPEAEARPASDSATPEIAPPAIPEDVQAPVAENQAPDRPAPGNLPVRIAEADVPLMQKKVEEIQQLLSQRRTAEAIALCKKRLAESRSVEEREFFEKFRKDLQIYDRMESAIRLAERGKFDEALAMLGDILKTVEGPFMTGQLKALIEKIKSLQQGGL